MINDGEILIIVSVAFLGGLAEGWWMRGVTVRNLLKRNTNQEQTIATLTELVTEERLENKRWQECRFYGGTPPKPEPPQVRGLMPGPWSAQFVRERAKALLG